jgi:hypothetical protein
MSQKTTVKSGKVAPIEKRPIEVADILREHIGDYQRKYVLQPDQYKIVYDLLNFLTAYLGGHIERCDHCGAERATYHSCRNRHCPKCQSMPRERWLEARKKELLPVIYFHTVFTLPHELNPIIFNNRKVMLDILFKAASETLLRFGENPHNGLGGKLGFIAIMHTWDQLLNCHYHLHCLIPGGALSEDWASWIPCKNQYLFNEEAMSLVFRGTFIEYMSQAYRNGQLRFSGISAPYQRPEGFQKLRDILYAKPWVVNMQKPINRPEGVLEYLGRYTHRVAISNHRIVSLNDGMVTFTYKNRKTNQITQATVSAVEFIRRFLLHALPKGFVRIRHFGFLANRNKAEHIKKLRRVLELPLDTEPYDPQSIEELIHKLTGIDLTLCPCCKKGKMILVGEIPKYTGICPNDIIRPPDLRNTA